MPYYNYEARSKNARLIKGQTFALNRQELLKVLQQDGLLVVSVKEAASISGKHTKRRHRRARPKDLSLFAKEMAILLENGVAMIEALDVIMKQLESTDLVNALKAVKKDLEGGSTLAGALNRHPRTFTSFWRDMCDAGEIAGQLPFVLKQIAVFLEARDDIKKKTINALLYPALLVLVASFTVVIFVFRIIPVFKGLFATFNAELPPLTQAILTASEIIKKYFLGIFILLCLAGVLLKMALDTKQGRRAYENIILATPVAGGLFLALAIERFASTLGVLLKSGIPIIKAMEVSAKTSPSLLLSERIEEAKVKVMGGLPFSESLNQTDLFPPLAVQLVLVAEKTGNYSGMLEEVSKYYADVIDVAVARFTALIGPVVIVFMAAIIGTIIVAMFLPIFKIARL